MTNATKARAARRAAENGASTKGGTGDNRSAAQRLADHRAAENGAAVGQPQSFTLDLHPAEVNLIHQMLVQGSFQQVEAKQVAASLQAKIEQLVQE